MKNIVQVDLDSDRKQQIMITKPENMVNELDSKSAKEMLLLDVTTLCNGLGSIIQVGDDNKFFDGEELATLCIKYLQDNFLKIKTDEEE